MLAKKIGRKDSQESTEVSLAGWEGELRSGWEGELRSNGGGTLMPAWAKEATAGEADIALSLCRPSTARIPACEAVGEDEYSACPSWWKYWVSLSGIYSISKLDNPRHGRQYEEYPS